MANRVATITLNRPDKLNAWTKLMESEVRSQMENAEQDDEVHVIVLTGAGRGFCAGADMSLLSAVADRGLDNEIWIPVIWRTGASSRFCARTPTAVKARPRIFRRNTRISQRSGSR